MASGTLVQIGHRTVFSAVLGLGVAENSPRIYPGLGVYWRLYWGMLSGDICWRLSCHRAEARQRRSSKTITFQRLAGAAGIEPANADTKNRCLTTWPRPIESKPKTTAGSLMEPENSDFTSIWQAVIYVIFPPFLPRNPKRSAYHKN